jgi:magnesium transporter
MQKEKEIQQLIDVLEGFLHQKVKTDLHYSDLSKIFKRLRRLDEERFSEYIKRMPTNILGDILESFNEKMLKESLHAISLKKMISTIKKMDSDDATDLLQDIEELDHTLSEEIIAGLDNKEQEEIQRLKGYEENEAGAYMQTEFFAANHNETIKETIENLRKLKYNEELENVTSVFIIGDYNNLVATVQLEDMLLFDFEKSFKEIISKRPEKYKPRYVNDKENIEKVVIDFKEYDLQVLPVIDDDNYLVGRITADDIYDLLQEMATEQIYNMVGVDEETETEKNVGEVIKKRGSWLFVNLWTAVLGSLVISQFEGTIKALPTLAVLMPIVASMGGNGGNQTLAVMVRKLALGEIDDDNWKDQMGKEIFVAVMNGLIFAVLIGLVTYLWKHDLLMSVVIGTAMIINLIVAGVSGGLIPIMLKKFNVDPAVGSSVILTTLTDVIGFFAFLGLAQMFILS